jgi:hypothetical protein
MPKPNFLNVIKTTLATNEIYSSETTVSYTLQHVWCLILSVTINYPAIYWLVVVFID